jgi:hypothetical protein
LLTADSPAAWRRWGLGLLGATAALIALRLYIGCPIIGYDLQDTLWVLSRAEQLVQGQVPHCDYFAFHGVAPFLLIAGGILLVGCRGLAITAAFAILAPVVAAAGWFLARTRLAAVMAASFSLMLGLQCLSTSGPGGLSGSHAMIYNRFGWVMLSLVAVQTLIPPRSEPSARRTILERSILGLALACLAFTKLNFFAAGIVVYAGGCVLFAQTRRGIFAAIAGFLAGSLFFLAFLRFDLLAYCNNILFVCGAVSGGSRLPALLLIVERNLAFVALACVPLVFVLRQLAGRAARERHLTEELRIAAAGLGLLLLGLIVCAMNAQDLGIPLFAVAAGATWEAAFRENSITDPALRAAGREEERENVRQGERETRDFSRSHALTFSRSFSLLAALASFLPVLAVDIAAIGLSLQWKIDYNRQSAEDAALHSPTLQDIVCPARRGQATDPERIAQAIGNREILTPHYMAVYLNDGLDLLKPYAGPADRVFCIDEHNLFPLALGLPYAAGDTGDRFCSKQLYPSAEAPLHDVTLVMEPKEKRFAIREAGWEFFHELFASVLPAEFERIGESRYWVMWRRRAEK